MIERPLFDAAVPVPPGDSRRANPGDICVAVDALGGHWIGRVIAIDAGGAATRLDIGSGEMSVVGTRRGVESAQKFLPTVRVAFGWCSSREIAAKRLNAHIRPPAVAAKVAT